MQTLNSAYRGMKWSKVHEAAGVALYLLTCLAHFWNPTERRMGTY